VKSAKAFFGRGRGKRRPWIW